MSILLAKGGHARLNPNDGLRSAKNQTTLRLNLLTFGVLVRCYIRQLLSLDVKVDHPSLCYLDDFPSQDPNSWLTTWSLV